MDINKANKTQLKAKCDELGIRYSDETNKELIALIRAKLDNSEVVKDTEDVVEKEIPTKESNSHKVKGYYKSKQRWIYLGEFINPIDVEKAARKKGSKVFKIK